MVRGQGLQTFARRIEVDTAVANVRPKQLAVQHECRAEGGAPARRAAQDGFLGGFRRPIQRVLNLLRGRHVSIHTQRLKKLPFQDSDRRANRRAAGHLTVFVPAHAVGNNEQPIRCLQRGVQAAGVHRKNRILILFANLAKRYFRVALDIS